MRSIYPEILVEPRSTGAKIWALKVKSGDSVGEDKKVFEMLNYEYLRVHIDSTKFRGQEYVGLAWMRSLAGEQMGLKGGLKFSGSSWEDLGRFCQVHWKITTSSGNLWQVQRVKLKFM